MFIQFDKLKNFDVRNTCDILWKYCNLQMNKVSVGSASVGFEQPSDQHVQKMAPQQKKTASPKMIAAKKISLRKTAQKKTGSKTTAAKKMSPKMKTAPKKTPAKKTSAKKTAPKKVALKKAALKKKIATKRSAKVGERMAKKDPVKGKKKTISKSSEECAARAARRSLAKEAPAGKDLINLLPTELLLLVTQVLGSSSLLTFVELVLTFHRSSPC